MQELTGNTIELINAHGPYNHAVWAYEGRVITNEEKLAGRAELLSSKLRESILKNFSLDEIKQMSIADVGCYDGWILQSLSDLPFAEIVGIEPRENNIAKAKIIRELLGIPSRIKFEIGDIDALGKQQFDIVICTGVLHHLDSIPMAIHKLRSACKKMLFLETICLSSKYISKDFKKEIEMKDIAYFNRARICGITGQKYESSYYDGSTDKLRVVSVPSIETLNMYLETEGFKDIQTILKPKSYNLVWKKNRQFVNAVLLSAKAGEAIGILSTEESVWIESYEMGLLKAVLDRNYIEPLYNWAQLGKLNAWNPRLFSTFLYLRAPNWLSSIFLRLHKAWVKDRFTLEIIKNLKFNTTDKLCLEYGKILYREKDYQQAISVLKKVTHKLNADWRSVYRSFYLLSLIYQEMGTAKESEHYRDLCLTCNLKYPIK
jgi:2-polyprenyl-3-methyl-5-hydroxy-6-metoxy-1,4-benzoquinol methylase